MRKWRFGTSRKDVANEESNAAKKEDRAQASEQQRKQDRECERGRGLKHQEHKPEVDQERAQEGRDRDHQRD